jgi:RNA-directed DNA polymerase
VVLSGAPAAPRHCVACRLACLACRCRSGRSLAQIVKELSIYLIGWRGYFGFCQTPSVLRALDEWSWRLRAVTWKQWKRGRTRFC